MTEWYILRAQRLQVFRLNAHLENGYDKQGIYYCY